MARYCSRVARSASSGDLNTRAIRSTERNYHGSGRSSRGRRLTQLLCAISDRPHRATRKNKDFALADRIRDRLKANHVVFKDTPLGMRLKLAKVAERP